METKTTKYNLQFEKLCTMLKLGEVIDEPQAISGGLLHRMYLVKTTKGMYAIKALNPQIMLRPAAMQDYIRSEKIVNIAARNLLAVPALKFNGNSIQEVDKQFYLVFDWVEGKSLKPYEITSAHCIKIGNILAKIHRTDFSRVGISNELIVNTQIIDWNYYVQRGKEKNAVWVNLLQEIVNKLYHWNAQANESANLLAKDVVISHRDLDSKNVMWMEDNPFIIDWESAGYTNPMHELVETAIYWSENEIDGIDKERFFAFIDGYKESYGVIKANWAMVLANGFLGKLQWLEYSLKRSLWIDCTDEEEQKLGTEQVTGTINAVISYEGMISKLEQWLYNC